MACMKTKETKLDAAARSRSGAETLLELLRRRGVDTIFGAGGSSLIPITDALLDAPDLRYVLALHEFCTVAMADGYARASGKPAVAAVHVGPGTMNALGAMYSALRDRSPVIVLCGQRDTRILGRDCLNEVPDLAEIPRQCTKWSVQIERVDRLMEIVSRAFQIALSPPQGPVFVALPKDVLRGEEPENPRQAGFAGDAAPALRGDAERLAEAAGRLCRAKHPLLLMGSGVARSRASRSLVKLAELLGVPIMSEVPFSALWDFPVDHPLYQGDFSARSSLVLEADLVLSIGGTVFQDKDFAPGPVLPEGVPIIQIHPDPWEIGKMFPAEVAIIADERSALEDLAALVHAGRSPEEERRAASRLAQFKTQKAAMRAALEQKAKTGWGETPLKAWQVVSEIMEVAGPEAVVIEECVTAAESVRAFGNTGNLIPENRAGHLGWGISGAIGAKLALPDRPVIAFLGDGAFMFGVQGIWTAAKWRLPILFVVFRNRAYMVDRSQKAWDRGDYPGTDLGDPDISFANLAQSLGVEGYRIETPEKLKPTAASVLKNGRPALLECIMEEKNARRIFEDIQWQPWLAIHASPGPV
jgi:benzoylformate decarboxylase